MAEKHCDNVNKIDENILNVKNENNNLAMRQNRVIQLQLFPTWKIEVTRSSISRLILNRGTANSLSDIIIY